MASRADLVLDRVNSVCAAAPYHYEQAIEPFSLDLQPDGSIDQCYHVGMEMVDVIPQVGYFQTERWEVRVTLARKHATDPHGVQRKLVVDVTSMIATLVRDDTDQDWTFEDDGFEVEIPEPEGTDAYIVAELTGVANFERAL